MKLQIQKSTRETDIVEQCKKQHAKAQRMLYDRYAPLMMGLCSRYVPGAAEAEDVMIGGFMKIFAKIDDFEGKGSFEGWMKRIMINEALAYIRRNKSMYLETDIETAEREPDYDRIDSELEARDLLNMVQELPGGYRTVFNLYAIEGYSHKEIAELLGINENTSKSQLSRARMQLQRKILDSDKVLDRQKIGTHGKKA
jgi:RNA polymerase sigma factor (sigma-70 family)